MKDGSGDMPVRSELVFEYNEASFVVSGTCSICGEKMPQPPPNISLSADRVLWFAERFIEHKQHRHPTEGGETKNRL